MKKKETQENIAKLQRINSEFRVNKFRASVITHTHVYIHFVFTLFTSIYIRYKLKLVGTITPTTIMIEI